MQVQRTQNQQSFGMWHKNTSNMSPFQMKLMGNHISDLDNIFRGLKVDIFGKDSSCSEGVKLFLFKISRLSETGGIIARAFRPKFVHTTTQSHSFVSDSHNDMFIETLKDVRRGYLEALAKRRIGELKLDPDGTTTERELARMEYNDHLQAEIKIIEEEIAEDAVREQAELEHRTAATTLDEIIKREAKFHQ